MGEPEGVESQWTLKGFNDRFDQILKENPEFPYWRAYESTEEEHKKLFGKFRYASYDSFRDSRRRLIFKET